MDVNRFYFFEALAIPITHDFVFGKSNFSAIH